MIGITLPTRVVAEDHRLEKAAEGSARVLMEHRWHWTLDEKNDHRVSIRHYAKEVGKALSIISRDAHGYEFVLKGKTPSDAREKAAMSEETFAATEAVAEAKGITVHQARQAHKKDVQAVKTWARERAERGSTLPREELTRAAKDHVRIQKTEQAEREKKKRQHTMRWFHIDGYLDDARRELIKAIDEALIGDLDAEERDLLLKTLDQVTEAARLTREAIIGKSIGTVRTKLEVLKGGLAS